MRRQPQPGGTCCKQFRITDVDHLEIRRQVRLHQQAQVRPYAGRFTGRDGYTH